MANFDGVDIDRVKHELTTFVQQAAPENGSGNGFITTQAYARCGRDQAITLAERVRPILNQLYTDWRLENPEDPDFEFQPEYDASTRLLARIASDAEIQGMLGDPSDAPKLPADQLHTTVWLAASAQWRTGHRHEAVLAGAKSVNSILQQKLGRRDLSEVKLVRDSFSDKPPVPGRPRLRFAGIEDEQTRESMREGAMNFGAGCFMAIRNPIGHLPNDEHELSEQEALERLAALSLLARWIDQAEVIR